MPRPTTHAVLVASVFTLASAGPSAQAQFHDPAVHGLERLEPLVLGVDNDSSKMAPTEYRLKVGQGYRWKIVASDLTEYAFVAPEFIRNIWIRKIEAGDPEVEIKAVTFDELEFENGGEVEVFFVAVRPGTYEFGPKGLMERGMVGKIIVEQAGSGPAATTPAAKKATDDDDEEDDR
jgi:plastocyanin